MRSASAVPECLRYTETDDQQARGRGQHQEANEAFLGLDETGEEDVTHPRPPDHREHEHASTDPRPIRLTGNQRSSLREAEHEDQVEEELERLDRLSLPQFRV